MLTVVRPSSDDALISCERHRLEKHLRQDDRRSAIEVDAASQPRDGRGEIAEIAQAHVANRRAGRIRMHVDDVGAERHVHGHRNAQT